MEKDIIDVVIEKQYFELNSNEREELAQYCSGEDEYNHLREVMIGVQNINFEAPTPKSETKQKLDDLFDQSYPKASPVWYMSVIGAVVPKEKPIHRQPLVQIAAVALLVLLAVPLFNTEIVSNDNDQIAMVEKEQVQEQKEGTSTVLSEDQESTDNDELAEPNTDISTADNFDEKVASNSIEVSTRSTERLLDLSTSPAPTTFATSTGAVATGFDHPDGVFDASVVAANDVSYSVSASDEPDVLDLLTATF